METVKVNFQTVTGPVKPMHAVNNGPIAKEESSNNFEDFRELKIPLVRNHDASFCADYGGEHIVDVHVIFPNFDADPEDPASYDFVLTDIYIRSIVEAGCQVYYRLGTKIEHEVKKYGTLVPKDFHKWAVICEHIIRHYNEGWADGYHWDIRWWQIWNEPDGIAANGDQPNWSGTPEQFYELYDITSRHLKACFPDLKIGGPAMSYVNEPWLRGLLHYIKRSGDPAPMDFIGFHWYATDLNQMAMRCRQIRSILDEEGYTNTLTSLDEWNYPIHIGWRDDAIACVRGMRGAAFVAAAMCRGQREPVDVMMYYDARPRTAYNGLFDFYTKRPQKTYYSLRMFSELYRLGQEVSSTDGNPVYACAATDGTRHALLLSCFDQDRNLQPQDVTLEVSGWNTQKLRRYDLDEDRSMLTKRLRDGISGLHMDPDSVVLLTDYDIYD